MLAEEKNDGGSALPGEISVSLLLCLETLLCFSNVLFVLANLKLLAIQHISPFGAT